MVTSSILFKLSLFRAARLFNESALATGLSTHGFHVVPAGAVTSRSISLTSAFAISGEAAVSFHARVTFSIFVLAGTLIEKDWVAPSVISPLIMWSSFIRSIAFI